MNERNKVISQLVTVREKNLGLTQTFTKISEIKQILSY